MNSRIIFRSLPALVFLTTILGCATHTREVVVRERVFVPEPPSLSQGPGDALMQLEREQSATRASYSTTSRTEYDSEEEADYFHDDLAPYGTWIQVEEYGPCWQPKNCPPDWQPYTEGYWNYTDDAGWVWLSEDFDEPFGWCCFHYGRWAFVARYGWCWVPGREWAGAWVVWRHGGGHIGWAPMPPARHRHGIEVEVGVEIGEPPFWAFTFVEERFITDVRLREHIEPVTRNVTLINVTKNVTKYEIINGRRFNRGPDVVEIERRIGRPIPRLRLAEVADRRLHGPHGDRLNVYRPSLPERRHGAWTAMDRAIMAAHPSDQSEAAARATENARRPQSANARSRFVTEPPRALTAAEIQERRRQLETHHQRLQAEMDRRHARELEATAPGPMREQLLARQAAERQAFALQRQRMMAAAMNAQPSTVRRASAPMRRRS